MSVTRREFVTTAVPARVTSSASSKTLAAANGNRQQLLIFNESTAVLYLKYGATASATDYTVQIPAAGYWEMPRPIFRGQLDGIWASANGAAQVTDGV